MSQTILKTSSGSVTGVVDDRFDSPIEHYRGIQYGRIGKRFARPELLSLTGDLDATQFGPQCPQARVDVGHLLRIPPQIEMTRVDEDEFKCLNVNVSRPAAETIQDKGLLPVLLWIHGGSQCVTFPSAATSIGDSTRLVADSATLQKPAVVVTFNYRLNIFAFGDGKGERNLALQDQRLAIEWVYRYIGEFGGDPEQITLAGESAGAVYVHAHLLSKTPLTYIRRAALASGSLHLSPPLPLDMGSGLVARLEADLSSRGEGLQDAPAASLVQAVENCSINSMWLQNDPELDGWEERTEKTEALLISDVEYESAIWKTGIEKMKSEEIANIIDECCGSSSKLQELYHIYPDRPASCYYGALDLINDARFAFPAFEISEKWRKASPGNVYQCIVDQPNPWQSSSRAHHAVDLIFLFGGIDLSFDPAAERVASKLRESWLTFVHGESPWASDAIQSFGPFGKCGKVDEAEYRARRRVQCFEHLRTLGIENCRQVSGRLAAGRVSLLN